MLLPKYKLCASSLLQAIGMQQVSIRLTPLTTRAAQISIVFKGLIPLKKSLYMALVLWLSD